MWLKKLFGGPSEPKREEFSFENFAMLPLYNLLKGEGGEGSPFDEWRADDAQAPYFIRPDLEDLFRWWVWMAQFDVFYCLIGERLGVEAAEKARAVHAARLDRAPDAEWIKGSLDFAWNGASCVRKVIAKGDPRIQFNTMFAQFILTTHPASPFYREVDTGEQESESFLSALNALQKCITHGRARAFDYFSKTLNAIDLKGLEERPSSEPKREEFSFDSFVMLPLLRIFEEESPFSNWRADDPQDPYVIPRGIGSFFKFWVWATQLEVFYLLIEGRFGAELALKAREIHKARLDGIPDAKNLKEVLLLSEVAEGVRKEIAERGDARIEFAHMFSRINLTSHPLSPFNGAAHSDLQSDEDYIIALSALQKCVAHGRAAAFDYFENAFNSVSLKMPLPPRISRLASPSASEPAPSAKGQRPHEEMPPPMPALVANGAANTAKYKGPIYAGFWKRVAAYLLDTLTILISAAVVGTVSRLFFGTEFGPVFQASSILLAWLYHAIFESGPEQATFGKQTLGIKVVDLTGRRISFGRATGRYFGQIVSGLTLCIGYAMAGWTKHRQGLHDMMAGCLVVNEKALEAQMAKGVDLPAAPGMRGWQIAAIIFAASSPVVLGILAAIAIPQYQAYVERARGSDGQRFAQGSDAVAEAHFHLNTGETERLAEAVRIALAEARVDPRPPARRFDKLEERVAYLAWVAEMSERLGNQMGDYAKRVEFLKTLDYEAKRAGIDRQLLLALINELSDFRTYAILPSGSRGLMLIRPYWTRLIGDGDSGKLFSMRINLRYGTVLLRHYLDKRNGDLFLALNDFANDAYVRPPDTQTAEFPDRVLAHWKNRWSYEATSWSYEATRHSKIEAKK